MPSATRPRPCSCWPRGYAWRPGTWARPRRTRSR
ncbi:hypothetical protein ABZ613_23245 [Streptomyces collinus]